MTGSPTLRTTARPWRATVAVLLAALLGACARSSASPAADAPQGPVGGELTIAIGQPGAVDPGNAADRDALLVASTLCDSLLAVDPETGELVPALAESWYVSDGGERIALKLREGVRFPDGRELTSRDVVASLSRAASAEYAGRLAHLLEPIAGYDIIRGRVDDAPDEWRERLAGIRITTQYAFEIVLREPNAEFLRVLTHPVAAPLSSAALEQDPEGAATSPPCIGPYRLDEPWDADADTISLSRNDDYAGYNDAWTYGGRGYLDRITFRVVDALVAAPAEPPSPDEDVTSGEDAAPAPEVAPPTLDLSGVDLARLPSDRWPQVAELGPFELVHAPGPGLEFVGVPIPPLSAGGDETVSREERAAQQLAIRRALSLAIDRRAVAEALGGARVPATGYVPPSLGRDGASCPDAPETGEPEAAVAALEASAADLRAAPLVLVTNDDYANVDIAEAVAAQWRQHLGLTVEVRAEPFATYLELVTSQSPEIGAFRSSWAAPYASLDAYLYPLFSSTRIGQENLVRYENPAFDELLLEDARGADDPADRELLYAEAVEVLCRDLPLIPVTAQRFGYAVGPRVGSATGHPVGGFHGLPLVRELQVADAS